MLKPYAKHYFCLILLSIGAAACDESQGFSPNSAGQGAGPDATTPSDGSVGTGIPNTASPTSPPNPPSTPVCGGFSSLGGGGTASQNNGLQASLNYIPFSDFSDCNDWTSYYSCNRAGPLDQDSLTVASFLPGATDVVTASTQVFLSSLNFPDQEFYEGMTTAQGPLQDGAGNTLIADFALFMQGSIMLNAGDPVWTPGSYQLAILTDDGAILYIDPTGKWNNVQPWISNDQTRSNTLACATQTISLTAGVPVPMKMNYFQGPPVRIALMLLWRKLPTQNIPKDSSTSLCGAEEDDSFYFSQVGNPAVPVPTSNYQTLLNNGWAPIPAANLYLPNSGINPCSS